MVWKVVTCACFLKQHARRHCVTDAAVHVHVLFEQPVPDVAAVGAAKDLERAWFVASAVGFRHLRDVQQFYFLRIHLARRLLLSLSLPSRQPLLTSFGLGGGDFWHQVTVRIVT